MKINIREIDSLKDFDNSIHRFCTNSENIIFQSCSSIERRLEEIKKKEMYFLNTIAIKEEAKRHAEAELDYCLNDLSDNEKKNILYRDCSIYELNVRRCEQELGIAEYNYNVYLKEVQNLEIIINDYNNEKTKFMQILSFQNDITRNCLKQIINGAEDYISFTLNDIKKTDYPQLHIEKNKTAKNEIWIPEINIMNTFSFSEDSKNIIQIKNKYINDLISTYFYENEIEHICSELKIESTQTGIYAKIASINVPPPLQSKKIGRFFISNIEAICKANNCKEVSCWVNENNLEFYKDLGFEIRHEIKGAGCEMFKSIKNNFSLHQKNAKSAFSNVDINEFCKKDTIRSKYEINPLYIISPDIMNEESFWRQHNMNQYMYFDLLEKYKYCKDSIKLGKSIDDIKKENPTAGYAYDTFYGSEPISLLKYHNYYLIDKNGRHRVAAAQIYYLTTGKIIYLNAEIVEKN